MAAPTHHHSNPALSLVESSSPNVSVSVHPLVLLSVLDHHTRRQEPNGRVIGTLLGKREGNNVTITNCFAVPHAERGDEVAIGKDFNRQMLSLHLLASKHETVVGWYGTALPDDATQQQQAGNSNTTNDTKYLTITDTSSLIHEFYSGECEDPIHLVVDTSMESNGVPVRAYHSLPLTVKGMALANVFHEVRCSVVASDPERIVVHNMIQNVSVNEAEQISIRESNQNGLDLTVSVEKLLGMLEKASSFVDGVIANEGKSGDMDEDEVHEVGRKLADTLSGVPSIREEDFESMFNENMQDLLMVSYLSNLTKTQLTIAEKLNASLSI
mmetsp:Transcript_15975/g.24891  ORF Transcript_15975/g.24891 Transcript_15975/m.24891 type:complete len:327 (+) Transcript_15975:78-1058(+)|eukprot:CAMPEP_0196801756 /NCGR_PEP_ID=MMETSP1362-20130617/1533_1 /TAXON_ID=163516 /ORGANISM="Leptocylindrus danicus, Strain CCMP1856" /LENGTH=326 /DNA_ID=CAMNT_0042172857 /DNA_START=49 /DNA_END=1029 /DNA_ORIENTATION=+